MSRSKGSRVAVTLRIPPFLHAHLAAVATACKTPLNDLVLRRLRAEIEGLADIDVKPALHFVGFRDDRFWNAVWVWGYPDFIHPTWDPRAQREIAPGDTILFAEGDETQELARFNATDFVETEPKYNRIT